MKTHVLQIRDRVRGAIIGAMIGEAIGNPYVFLKSREVGERLGHENWAVGNVGDETQLMIALFKSLRFGTDNFENILRGYVKWAHSNPMDMDYASCRVFQRSGEISLSVQKDIVSQANYGGTCSGILLARQIPWCIAGIGWKPEKLRQSIRKDVRLSHSPEFCSEECELYALVLQSLLQGCERSRTWQNLFEQVKTPALRSELLDTYYKTPVCDTGDCHGARVVLKNALHHLWRSDGFMSGIRNCILRGGATDTNGCVTGALLGAYWGLPGIPKTWVKALLENPQNAQGTYDIRHAIIISEEMTKKMTHLQSFRYCTA